LLHCESCKTRHGNAVDLVALLDSIPHLRPPPDFANRVMAQVHVFEPAHITAINAVRRIIPSGNAARLALGSAAASVGFMLTVALIWVAARADALVFAGGVFLQRTRLAILAGIQGWAMAIVGEPTAEMLDLRGAQGVWVAAAMLGASTIVAAVGLRAATQVARRRRE
jgi:hypothetical protein